MGEPGKAFMLKCNIEKREWLEIKLLLKNIG
jgi:hypothetical protein